LTFPDQRSAAASADSTIRWHSRKVFVGNLLKYHHVKLESVADGVWSVHFGPVHLGWLDEADFRIMEVKDRAFELARAPDPCTTR
jgi:hypothetical protein